MNNFESNNPASQFLTHTVGNTKIPSGTVLQHESRFLGNAVYLPVQPTTESA